MAITRGAYRYIESGLSDVLLLDVEILECSCGKRDVIVPRRSELHALIGSTIATDTTFPADSSGARRSLAARVVRSLQANADIVEDLAGTLVMAPTSGHRWHRVAPSPSKM
jgi:hypothetical protein